MTLSSTKNEAGYLVLLQDVMTHGHKKSDRTGVGTRSMFGGQVRYDLSGGRLPMLTTKKLSFKFIAHELLWFLSGSTDAADLQKHGVTIWDEWATPDKCAKFGREPGNLGPIYGHQWRNFGGSMGGATYKLGVDQIDNLMEGLERNPDSRRHIVTGWNPQEVNKVELPPCHTLFQFYVADNKLSCHLYQRSADAFLGVPYNVASYSLLTHMIATTLDMEAYEFIHSFGDVHLYNNHVDQASMQLSRFTFSPPKIQINKKTNLFDYVYEDFTLVDYNCHPAIRAPVAI